MNIQSIKSPESSIHNQLSEVKMHGIWGKLSQGVIALNGITALYFILLGFRGLSTGTGESILGALWIGSLFLFFMLATYMLRHVAGRSLPALIAGLIPWLIWAVIWNWLSL